MLSAIDEYDPACIFLAYPNNPTGNCFDQSLIEAVLARSTGLVVVDEAYFAFCGKSFVNKINRYDNLIVLRTLSKSGFAGLRLGVMLGNSDWVQEMEKLRLPYNINSLTQASAEFFLEEYPFFQQQSDQIVRNRSDLFKQLDGYPDIQVFPSETNFILCKMHNGAQNSFAQLKEKGVLVRNLHAQGSALEDCLRVTVSTEEENQLLLDALSSL